MTSKKRARSLRHLKKLKQKAHDAYQCRNDVLTAFKDLIDMCELSFPVNSDADRVFSDIVNGAVEAIEKLSKKLEEGEV